MTKIRIVFATEPETEYTVRANRWDVHDGALFTWFTDTYGVKSDQQGFSLANIIRWAAIE